MNKSKVTMNGHMAGQHWARRISLELSLKLTNGEPRNRAERRVLASRSFWSRRPTR